GHQPGVLAGAPGGDQHAAEAEAVGSLGDLGEVTVIDGAGAFGSTEILAVTMGGQEPENIEAHGVVTLVRRSPDAFRGWISRIASGLLESFAAAPPDLLRQAGGRRSGAWLLLPGYLGRSRWSIWPSP